MNNLEIDKLKDRIEVKFGKPNLESWRNGDFDELSRQIFRKTRVRISNSTLKRIFGKTKTVSHYTPQHSTLQALQDFVEEVDSGGRSETDDLSSGNRGYWKSQRILFIAVFVAGIGAYLFLKLIKKNSHANEAGHSAELSLKKLEGINKATARFGVIMEPGPRVDADLRVYYDDYSDTSILTSPTSSLAHYYQFPGVFKPKLFLEGRVISDDILVHVKTEGWYALGTSPNLTEDRRLYPVPNSVLYKPEGYLHLSASDFQKIGMDSTAITMLRLYNYLETGIDGDNFQMKLRLKNAEFWPGVQCNSPVVVVKGRNGTLQQYFPKPGCSFWVETIVSEKKISGRHHDMSAFCVDLSHWGEIQIINEDKHVSFLLDGKLLGGFDYTIPLGEILGIEVRFFGTGFLDYFRLSNNDLLYQDEFDSSQP